MTPQEFVSRLTSNHLVTIFLATAALVAAVIISAMWIWGRVRRARIAADLKLEMLERGMSAEDIKTVIDAGSDV